MKQRRLTELARRLEREDPAAPYLGELGAHAQALGGLAAIEREIVGEMATSLARAHRRVEQAMLH